LVEFKSIIILKTKSLGIDFETFNYVKTLTMKKVLILFIFFLSIFSGCEKTDKDCDKFPANSPEGLVQWNVLSVVGPTTSLVNQPLTLEVTYPTSSGCDYVSEFVTSKCSSFNILVKAYGNTIMDSPCTQAAVPKIINFEFTPDAKGQIEFEFINKDNSVIYYSMTIN
jgi:hypothetical protein